MNDLFRHLVCHIHGQAFTNRIPFDDTIVELLNRGAADEVVFVLFHAQDNGHPEWYVIEEWALTEAIPHEVGMARQATPSEVFSALVDPKARFFEIVPV